MRKINSPLQKSQKKAEHREQRYGEKGTENDGVH